MRTLELVRALSNNEVSVFEEGLKVQKRKSLQRLFALLKKYRHRQGHPGNDELYNASFEKEYSPDKNYLLRNELRLLNELLYQHFIQNTFAEYLRKHKSTYFSWLAQSFYDRKLNNAFSGDIDRFIEYSKEHIKPDDTARLLDLKNLWLLYNSEASLENLQQQIKLGDVLKSEQIRHLRYRLRETEARQAYLQERWALIEGHLEERSDDFRTEPTWTIDLAAEKDKDVYEKYLILKRYSYQTSGLKRIEIIKQMLDLDAYHKFDGPQKSLLGQTAALNNIAVEYIGLGQFAKADEYMLESIRRCQQESQPVRTWVIPNYIANQINQGRYQVGLDFYKEYKTTLTGSQDNILASIYTANCCLFLSQPDQALAVLPTDWKLNDYQQVIVRMVYLIAFILRNDHLLAINECRNLSRNLRTNESSFAETYIWITGLFLKYINALMKERKIRKEEVKSIKDELQAEPALNNLLTIEFSLRWFLAAVDGKG